MEMMRTHWQARFSSVTCARPKVYFLSPRLARIDWRLIDQSMAEHGHPPRLRHSSTHFPEPTQKPTAATVFSPRARAEMGPAMQVIL